MLLRALMLTREKLKQIKPDDTLKTALDIINENNFLSIPVVDGIKFYGVISKEMIYSDYFGLKGCMDRDEYLNSKNVKELMRKDIPILHPSDALENGAHTLEVYGVPFVALENDMGEFEGIITHHALFKQLADIMGINRGKRISVIIYDIHGQIARLAEVISKNGGDFISFVVIDPKVKTDVREVVIRVDTDNFVTLVDKIRDAGFIVQ